MIQSPSPTRAMSSKDSSESDRITFPLNVYLVELFTSYHSVWHVGTTYYPIYHCVAAYYCPSAYYCVAAYHCLSTHAFSQTTSQASPETGTRNSWSLRTSPHSSTRRHGSNSRPTVWHFYSQQVTGNRRLPVCSGSACYRRAYSCQFMAGVLTVGRNLVPICCSGPLPGRSPCNCVSTGGKGRL